MGELRKCGCQGTRLWSPPYFLLSSSSISSLFQLPYNSLHPITLSSPPPIVTLFRNTQVFGGEDLKFRVTGISQAPYSHVGKHGSNFQAHLSTCSLKRWINQDPSWGNLHLEKKVFHLSWNIRETFYGSRRRFYCQETREVCGAESLCLPRTGRRQCGACTLWSPERQGERSRSCRPNDNWEEGGVSIKQGFPLGFNFGGEGRVLKSPLLRTWEVVSRLHSRKQELRAILAC